MKRQDRPHHRTGLLRLESGLSAVAGQRGVLVRSSWARRLARVAGNRPQPPGSRLVYDSWFFIPRIEFRCYPLGIPTRRARRRLVHLASTSVLVCGSEREVQLPAPAAGRDDAARRRHTTRSVTQGLVALTETDLRHGSGYNLLLYPLDASMDPTSDRGGDCGHRSKRGTP